MAVLAKHSTGRVLLACTGVQHVGGLTLRLSLCFCAGLRIVEPLLHLLRVAAHGNQVALQRRLRPLLGLVRSYKQDTLTTEHKTLVEALI